MIFCDVDKIIMIKKEVNFHISVSNFFLMPEKGFSHLDVLENKRVFE